MFIFKSSHAKAGAWSSPRKDRLTVAGGGEPFPGPPFPRELFNVPVQEKAEAWVPHTMLCAAGTAVPEKPSALTT